MVKLTPRRFVFTDPGLVHRIWHPDERTHTRERSTSKNRRRVENAINRYFGREKKKLGTYSKYGQFAIFSYFDTDVLFFKYFEVLLGISINNDISSSFIQSKTVRD